MNTPTLMSVMILAVFAQTALANCVSDVGVQGSDALRVQDKQITISIATGGGPYGPAKANYRVGERVPLVITMTNTGTEPVNVCQSDMLYQDRPQLLKDGQPMAYMAFRQSSMLAAQKSRECDTLNEPTQILLPPNKPTVVDWFLLAEGAASNFDDAWYDPLTAGKYTISDKRRLSCCDGPFTTTNTISFVVGS